MDGKPNYNGLSRKIDYIEPAPAHKRAQWLAPLAAGLAILITFIALNYRAYDGYFQDDELDNLSWAPATHLSEFAIAFIKPVFDVNNFRPPGHLYFTLMGRAFGLDFPPYVTPIFAIHLTNALLLFLLMRKCGVALWCALAGTAFFTLSATAFDAYWKPMYVFDLLCTLFCLASVLLFAHGRSILSFLAWWFAYKSKELAVMLPFVLLAYEFWFGSRRYKTLIPFFAAALSFGIQGILLNPNKNNDYTFRFTIAALRSTVPYYAGRFLVLRLSGFALLGLLLVRNRRVWFGLAGMVSFLFVLFFLPGRLYEAYAYLPFAFATLALAGAASAVNPVWSWVALALWMPLNLGHLKTERRLALARDDADYAFVDQLQTWAAAHPAITTLIYDDPPDNFHHWGVTAAWNIAHRTVGLPVLYKDWPGVPDALNRGVVAIATRDPVTGRLTFQIHSPR